MTRVGLHLLAALRAAHSAGVVHRELRPDNVLLTDDGRVMLGGFGLSLFDGRAHPTVSGAALSTIQYVAPERARDRSVTPAADLWALGATLYLAAEGRQPWTRPSTLATLAALATEQPDPMRARLLEPTVTGLLRRNPRQRLTAVEAQGHLDALASPTVPAAPTRPRRWRPVPTARRRPARAAGPPTTVPGGQDAVDTTVITVATPVAPDRTGWAFAASVLGLLTVVAVVVGTAGIVIAGLGGPAGEKAPTPGGVAAGAPEAAPPAHPCLDGTVGDGEPLQQATPPPGDVPDGWQWHQDPGGFLVAVPVGWTRHTEDGIVCFRDPVELRAIAVDPAAEVDPVPSRQWQAAERDLVRSGAAPGYEKISIGPVIRPGGAAEWEYTFDQAEGDRMHARRLLINDSPTRAHSVAWLTRDSQWALDQPRQRLALASFRPD